MTSGRGRVKGLRPGRPPDPVVSQGHSKEGDDDADEEPHSLTRHETAGYHARPLQDPDRACNYGQQTENQTEDSHVITVRACVSVFSCEAEVALSRQASPQGEPPFRAHSAGAVWARRKHPSASSFCARAPRSPRRRTGAFKSPCN